jgi:hypothetical protein
MAVEWREFEQLVARIEQTLAPQGAVVTSPDRVKDLYTGQDREVDATIRFRVGTVPILITVECRKRDRVQDDTWLEQLAMKRTKVGAARTIAVASAGFTMPATVTAGLTGIEVRTIDLITPEDMRAWLRIDGIQHVTEGSELVSFQFELYGLILGLQPDVVRQMEADAAGARVFQSADGRQLCIRDLLDVAIQYGLKLHEGLPPDGTRRLRQVRINFPDQAMAIMTTAGPRYLKLVLLGIEAFRHQTNLPLPSGFDYSDPKDTLVRGIEHRPDIPGHDCIVTLVKEPGADEIKVNMMIRKKPERAEDDKPSPPA